MNSSWYKRPQLLVAYSAVFISLCALFATAYQAYIERLSLRLSVWPRLELKIQSSNISGITYSLVNKGIGPANVEYMGLQYDGGSQPSWQHVAQLATGKTGLSHRVGSIVGGVIAPGETFVLFQLENRDVAPAFFANYRKVALTLCYCSVFNECWSIDLTDRYERVDQCPAQEYESF